MILRAVIVEDEKKSRETLMGMLERFCPNVIIVGVADGVQTGREQISKNKPDLVFLDIQMQDGSGFKLIETIEDKDFDIIFTTAFDQYALRAIKYEPVDYLLKPIIPDELIAAVERAEQRKSKMKANLESQLQGELQKNSDKNTNKIKLTTSDKVNIVRVDDIIRCASDNYYTIFYFVDSSSIMISKTLKETEELLSKYNFIRPHKSHLINPKHIKSFLKIEGGVILMDDNSKIPVSRRKKEKIMEIFNKL